MRYADSISRDLFSEEQRRIASEVGTAEEEIIKYELANIDVVKLYSQAADLMRSFPTLYEASTPAARRQCNQAIFERIYLKGPNVTGARLTKIGAGLFEPVTGSTTWGKVPGEDGEQPDGGRRSISDARHDPYMSWFEREGFGGGERTRTADFYVANVALYRLSYTPLQPPRIQPGDSRSGA